MTSTDNMIEKVAKAMALAAGENWVTLLRIQKIALVTQAEAAIKAMQAPTKEMRIAGATARHSQACDGGYSIVGTVNAEAAYDAMLEAALRPRERGV